MARKKLKPFTADEAGDAFTPTVKTITATPSELEDHQALDDSAVKKMRKVKGVQKEKTTKKELAQEVIEEKKGAKKVKNEKSVKKQAIVKDQKVESEKKQAPKVQEVKKEEASVREPIEKPASQPRNRESTQPATEEKTVKVESETQGDDALIQLVGFCLGDEEFAVDIQKIQEINRMVDITRVPNTPDFVRGVINLRGKVIPVISLRERFGLDEKDHDKYTRIVVVEIEGKTIGLLVDSVSEVLRIPSSTIEPPPPIVAGINAEFIESVGKLDNRLLILLNLNKLLPNQEMDQMRKVA